MFDFEKALLGESMGVPIHEASAFFLEVRTPIKTASVAVMTKTAGWEDPPDELGVLEGQFEVPVPQAVALMGNCVTQFMKMLSASNIYPNSIRGPYASEVKGQITCNEWDHKRAIDYLVERMTVLAGAPHIPEPDMPPPCTDPIEAARKMIRAEQETIHSLRELYLVLGCNPMRDRVKEISSKCQEHLDKYWMAMPPELGEKPMDIKPPLKLQRHEANETPDMEALESPEFDQAEESVGVESPENEEKVVVAHKPGLQKTAALDQWSLSQKGPGGGDMFIGQDLGDLSASMAAHQKQREAMGSGGSTLRGVGYTAGGGALGAAAGGIGAHLLGLNPAVGMAGGAALGGLGGAYAGHRANQSHANELARLEYGKHLAKKGPPGGLKAGKPAILEVMPRGQGVKPGVEEALGKISSAMVKWAKDESDAELKEKGRQRGVTGIAAEHTREKARRGERAGKVLGAIGGAAGGAALGRKVVGGPAGTLGGAAVGGLLGRSAGGELGTEVDIARAQNEAEELPKISTALDKLAAEERKKGLGERIGGIGGAVLGGAAGGTAGAIGGGGVGSLALGAGGMTAGGMAGEALGSRVGRYIDEKGGKNVTNFGKWLYNPDAYKAAPEVQKAASAMALWVKTAQPPVPMEAEAPMASPTDAPELEPLNYMQAEQLGRQAQEMNESNYHKARAAQAEEGAAQAIQAAQAEADVTVQEAQQAIAEATGAEQKAQEMMGVAMEAKDQALQQTETAARIRMANQDLRMKLMEIASQEPDMAAAMNLTQATAQAPPASPAAGEAAAAEEAAAAPPPAPPENPAKAEKEVQQAQRAEDEAAQQAAQAEQATGGGGMEVQASANLEGMSPEAFIFGLPDPEGPVGKAPQPRTAPGAAPPEGAPDMNENAGGPIGPEGQLAVPSTFFKTAGPLGLAIGAPVGAGVAAFSADSRRREGIGPAQKKVEQLTASQDGSWGQASALARAKMDVADRELQQAHPGRYMAGKALGGAFRGAMGSSALENNLRYLLKG